jgi:hypothetical protein
MFGEYFNIRESPKIQIIFVICQAKMFNEKKILNLEGTPTN